MVQRCVMYGCSDVKENKGIIFFGLILALTSQTDFGGLRFPPQTVYDPMVGEI